MMILKNKNITLEILFALLILLFEDGNGSCTIKLDERGPENDHPMILDIHGKVVYPTDGRKLSFKGSEEIILFCHGVKNHFKSEKLQYMQLKCDDTKDEFLSVTTKKPVVVSKQLCKHSIDPEIIKMSKTTTLCSNVGADERKTDLEGYINLYQIGWNISSLEAINIDKDFIELIRICRDEHTYGTLWSYHIVHGESIEYQDKEPDRPSFKSDDSKRGRKSRFFGGMSSSKLQKLYSKKGQNTMLQAVLELTKHAETGKDIFDKSQNWLARGHLAPDASFVYQEEADATYFYINVAPQFQSFNNQNWKSLEKTTRDIAISRKRSIEVFVGTHELLRYTNASNMKEPLYLMYDSKNAIPVPLEYWKVMYDPVSHEAIAFLGNNNPHSKDIQSYKCKNICKSLKWNVLDDLLDDFEDETEGHVTCCAVKELQKHIPYLENLEGADGRKIIDASIMTNYETKDPKQGKTQKYPQHSTSAESSPVPSRKIHRPQFQTTGNSLNSAGISTASYVIDILFIHIMLVVRP